MGCFSKHIRISSSPEGDLFISINTQTLCVFLCFFTPTLLSRLSRYATVPPVSQLSVHGKYQVLIVMKRREAGLLGDDGKRQLPLTSAPVTSVETSLGEKKTGDKELFLQLQNLFCNSRCRQNISHSSNTC